MPDNNRLNLSNNLDQLDEDLLKDIHAAAEEVKKRQESDKAKEVKEAKKAETNKQSALIIGVAAVVLLVIAYFVVFAKPQSGTLQTGNNTYTPPPKVTVKTTPQAPQQPSSVQTAPQPAVPGKQDSQITNHPKDSYEQPSDPGM